MPAGDRLHQLKGAQLRYVRVVQQGRQLRARGHPLHIRQVFGHQHRCIHHIGGPRRRVRGFGQVRTGPVQGGEQRRHIDIRVRAEQGLLHRIPHHCADVDLGAQRLQPHRIHRTRRQRLRVAVAGASTGRLVLPGIEHVFEYSRPDRQSTPRVPGGCTDRC